MPRALGLLLVLCYTVEIAYAQSSGYLYRGTGPPVGTTYLVAPGTAPVLPPASAPSEQTAISRLQAQSSGADNPVGPCYCTPVQNEQTICFNLNTSTSTVDCTPPRAYSCQVMTAAAGIYTQQSGPVYNCTAASSASSPTLPTLPPLEQQTYTGVFQPNSTGFPASSPAPIQYESLPRLETGQDVDTDPDPPNAELQISGVDSIVNGHLDNIPLEPPNPAVCVGNGFALEVTNDVLVVYSAENGTVLAGPIDYQRFFGIQGPPETGLSDTYCLYDASDSERFFVSISYFSCRTAKCFAAGPVPIFSFLLIGVSKTSDPRDGFLGPYFVATDAINPETDQPYPGFGDCGQAPLGFTGTGCLGDYPNPGMDKNAFWFGMNIFTINAKTLIGANVFGVSKADLLSGQYSNPSVVTYTDWAPYPGFTIVPSMTQATSQHSSAQGGSVFLMSSDSFSYTGQVTDALGIPSIRTWAITNTDLFQQNFPDGQTPTLSPPVTLVTQPLGFTSTYLQNIQVPSGTSVSQPTGATLGAQDERMRQVAYSGGRLYSCLTTAVGIGNGTVDGLAYFVLSPSFTADGLYTADIIDQGYVATDGNNLLNGAVTATATGTAVITGSLVGEDYYLSMFYSIIEPGAGPGPIQVPRVSNYTLELNGPGALPQRRSGDYSTAVLDEQGNVWVVAEWASDSYITLPRPDTGAPQTGNWGTYIVKVNPYASD